MTTGDDDSWNRRKISSWKDIMAPDCVRTYSKTAKIITDDSKHKLKKKKMELA